MNKKFLGIRVATYIQALICVIVALCIWFFANYDNSGSKQDGETAYAYLSQCLEAI